MIKPGQIYKSKNSIYAVCFVGIGYQYSKQIQIITPCGFTSRWSYKKAEKYGGELIAEYPTWQEAVNSKEFKI